MGIDVKKLKLQEVKGKDTSSSAGIFDFLNKDIQLFGGQLSDKKKEAFYMELSILLSAGMDIKSTLELIVEEQIKAKEKALFAGITESIIRGNTLSDAIQETNKFSPYEFFSIQIGEESGKLAIVLKELAEFYQKKIKQQRQIIGALTYPVIVLGAALGAVFFMMNFVVPMFADVFKRFGGDLPFITKVILNASNSLKDNFLKMFLFLLVTIFLIYKQRKKLWFRRASSQLVLKMPLIGEMVRKIYLARFCHSMTLLISSKIPLLRAISLIKQMISFYPLEESLTKIEEQIMGGASLHASLSGFPIYHKRMISLIKVGEEVNQLELFFDKISKQYNEDIDHQTSIISSLVEPFMIIFLGLVVGVILIAMYLPLFSLSNSF